MKLYAPAYYREFACIAHRCRHSCCVGWEIDVDGDTAARYAALTHPYGDTVRASLEGEAPPHFRLCADERCPHLDDRGLCRIISSLGEGYLCDICREHPRFYHDTPLGKEVGLGMACEEACRIILSSDGYATVTEIGDTDDGEGEAWDFDPLPHRQRMYDILSDTSRPYADRLQALADTYAVTPDAMTDVAWQNILAELEYLHGEHRALFATYTSDLSTPTEAEPILERALAYFIYRHVTPAWDGEDLRAALGFCLLCERLLCAMVKANDAANDFTAVCDLARILSEEIEYSEDNTDTLKHVFYT